MTRDQAWQDFFDKFPEACAASAAALARVKDVRPLEQLELQAGKAEGVAAVHLAGRPA